MKVIVNLAGGFGNQLFCYSFGYALAKRKNAELIIDTSTQDNGLTRSLELMKLNIRFNHRISYKYKKGFFERAVLNKIRKRKAIGFTTKIYNEINPTIFEDAVFDIQENTYFKGNWQSEKYFINYRDELLEMLTPKEERNVSVRNLSSEMNNCNSVAVHIRRGDYVKIGCQLNMSYYDAAISMIRAKLPEAKLVLYIFSDDIDFCKKYFSEKQEFADKGIELCYPQYKSDNYTLDDLFLMSNCKHMIMANSSYSWWAAWLNQNKEKIVICPELGMWKGDFYPDNWIKIRCDE